MDISKVTNPEAKRFLIVFLKDRKINREVYKHIPENMFDFRMVNAKMRKSDTPRESLIHQIYVTRNHIHSLKNGNLQWGSDDIYGTLMKEDFKNKTKDELLALLAQTEKELIKELSNPHINKKKIKVDWSSQAIPALVSIWSLDRHEVLHTGWNLALMDNLNIERFRELKEMWG